ncbi:hypothetical protein V8G54_025571 [Vigna mungo]|uniref:PB1-like domain-containing protein n=1 Tax=Vigna mungo TaxID=3915 RepID=A0AAQ3MYI3_VIGMU
MALNVCVTWRREVLPKFFFTECAFVVVVGVVGPSSAAIWSGQEFDVVFHHGGKLVNDGKLNYFVIVSVVKSLGYHDFKELWYFVGGALVLDDKLECLCDDTAAMHVVNLARLNGEARVFVIHLVSEAQVIHMAEYIGNDEGQVEEKANVDGEQQDMSVVDGEEQEMGEQVEAEVVMEEEGHGVEQAATSVLEEMGEQVEVEVVMEEEGHGVEQAATGVLEEMGEQVEVEVVMEEKGHGVEQATTGVLEEMGDVGAEVEVEKVGGEVEVEKVGGHGEVEGAEQNEVEPDVEIRSWNSSFESGSGHGNTDWLEGLVDVNVGCDMDDDIHADLEGNVEVKVQRTVDCPHTSPRDFPVCFVLTRTLFGKTSRKVTHPRISPG